MTLSRSGRQLLRIAHCALVVRMAARSWVA